MTRPVRQYIYTPPDQRPIRQPSPQRARVLAFIKAEIAAGRPFPSTRAIADHIGWARTESAANVLAALAVDGLLRRRRHGLKFSTYEVVG